jgi:hypothetical protein
VTPEQRTMRARLAAYTRWSKEDPSDPNGSLRRAQKASMDRFEREVDPDQKLPPAERARRAEAARRAYFTRLALMSSQARSRRKRLQQGI